MPLIRCTLFGWPKWFDLRGTPLRPRHTYQLRGRVLNELEGGAIKSADLIEEPKDAV